MITLITQWSIGFSLISCLLLGCVYGWVYEAVEKTALSKLACAAMLGSIGVLQLWHGWALATGASLFEAKTYLAILYFSTIAFFAFYSTLINAQIAWSFKYLVLIIPSLIGPWLPAEIAIPSAFLMGGAGAIRLILRLHPMQEQRQYFTLEKQLLASIGLVAFLIVLVGLVTPWVGEQLYVVTYSNLSAMIFAFVLWLLLRYPDVMRKAAELVANSYAKSTLTNENSDQLGQTLQALMTEQHLYEDDALNLTKLSKALALTNHQTSELVNTHFEMSVSRFIHHYRINAAKELLLKDHTASVLSVAMSVGFNSQSTFYTAFRDVTGQTPNQYRKNSQ